MASVIAISVRLLECRNAARQTLGEKYSSTMREYAEVIQAVAAAKQLDILVAATRCADCMETAMGKIIVLAAAVELLDPSPV